MLHAYVLLPLLLLLLRLDVVPLLEQLSDVLVLLDALALRVHVDALTLLVVLVLQQRVVLILLDEPALQLHVVVSGRFAVWW